ncbi:hypothetical protein [Caulobacter soli]|uniref:hypothetical protein n=1 Tax=Caulobacter soli TaxID=2708539 RepID=UPI0013EB5F54|nr:hypothetical protein [Caulobacter soli]
MCQHLVEGVGLGFNEPYGKQDEDASDEQAAWCDRCEEARLAGGGWTPQSEAQAGISLICAVCFEASRARNTHWMAAERGWRHPQAG